MTLPAITPEQRRARNRPQVFSGCLLCRCGISVQTATLALAIAGPQAV